MRTGVTLAQIRKEVQIEAGLSTAPGHSAQQTERINHRINRIERHLQMLPGWPTRKVEVEVEIDKDERYGSLPEGMSFTDVEEVWCDLGVTWLPVAHGIGMAQRSLFGPDTRSSPITHWEIQSDDPTTYEVWPIPSQDHVLRFTGVISAGNMAKDTDTCVLDADVIALMAAAEMVENDKPEEAASLRAKADNRLKLLLNRQNAYKSPDPVMSRRYNQRLPRPSIDFIPPRG